MDRVKGGRDEDRGRERERCNEVRTRDRELGRDCERDIDRERGCDRDRQYTLTQRPSKQYNIELNWQIMRIRDKREICEFIVTQSAVECQCGHFISQNTSSFTGSRAGIRAARTGHP